MKLKKISGGILAAAIALSSFGVFAEASELSPENTDFLLQMIDNFTIRGKYAEDALKSCLTPMFTVLDEQFTLENSLNSFELARGLNVKMTFAADYETLQNASAKELAIDCYTKLTDEAAATRYGAGETDISTQFIMRCTPADTDTQRDIEVKIKQFRSFLRNSSMIDYEYVLLPQGQVTETAKQASINYAKGMLDNADSGSKINYGPEDGRYALKRITINKDTDVDAVKKTIDLTAKYGGWVIFSVNSADTASWNADKLTQVISYAVEKGVTDKTLGEAMTLRQYIYAVQEIFS